MADPFGSSADNFNNFQNPNQQQSFGMQQPRTSFDMGSSFNSNPNLALAPAGLPLLAVWSVPQPEKAKADQLFGNIDQDRDGLVNGMECKPMFLQSGLQPGVLAQIWALCDIRKNGVLNAEQFALAVHLIQLKLRQGVDPPVSLPPDLVPPSMRMYVTQFPVPSALLQQPELVDDDEGGDEGLKKELQDLEEEIAGIRRDKAQIVQDVEGRKAEMQMRQTELQNLAKELDALQAAAKQLDTQRGEAQKRLDDLDGQKGRLQTSVTSLTQEIERERERTKELKAELERRQMGQKEQDEEVTRKKRELQKLKQDEAAMQQKLDQQKNHLLALERCITDGDVKISQLEGHVSKVEELNQTLKEAIGQFDAALASNDVASINPTYLQKSVVELTFNASHVNLDPITPIALAQQQQQHHFPDPAAHSFDDPFQGEDPFAKAGSGFGGAAAAEDPWGASPFGASTSDSFGAFGGGFGQQGPESPLPALPPKKTQQSPGPATGATRNPPPRPAPPKAAGKSASSGKREQAAPARDAFEGDPWGSGGGSGGVIDGTTGNVGYNFPAFEQPAPANFATDFDDFAKF
ncbi:putative Epidermal growth factor receptor substrate 15-like 1 [Hypsibius exemplaris]|uniref:Epidermal growth factor receptor substrate 15-like 1 n=1 Tax=Hypsibius exemplaris TaxID=2072580 RepID=A0A1W0WBJ9_HYPEX|nr:putative Epidermal growth factor receptor substrate 15-like 1 [Hypsibius exemplaris]